MNRAFIITTLLLSSIIFLLFCMRKKYDFYSDDILWKLDYLRKIYPLLPQTKGDRAQDNNISEDQIKTLFNNLTVIYTNILGKDIDKLITSKNPLYVANLPGPSCEELPCSCTTDTCPNGDNVSIPNVKFDPDVIFKKQWPPCNIPGEDGKICCKSVDAYKKCMTDGTWEKLKLSWSGDTWEGNNENKIQPPPNSNQLFKPTLWPDYTLSISKYNPTNWNETSLTEGVKDKYMEVLHSSFTSNDVMPGLWFYNATGSGIFLEIDPKTTLIAKNKFHALELLYKAKYPTKNPYVLISNFILAKNNGDIIMDNSNCTGWLKPIPDSHINGSPLTIDSTGLDGYMQYWLNGQYKQTLKDNHPDLFKNLENLPKFLEDITYSRDYDTNRIANTGDIDHLLIYLAKKAEYTSIQLTVQPNVYTGWTIEVILLGEVGKTEMYSNIDYIKTQNNKPEGGIAQTKLYICNPLDPDKTKQPCTRPSNSNWKFSKCLYCDQLPETITKNCKDEIQNFSASCKYKYTC